VLQFSFLLARGSDAGRRTVTERSTMAETEATRPQQQGELQAEISNLVVRLFAEYTGRGPTKARTIMRDNLLVCVTADSMTKAERQLVAVGEAETVKSIRRKFQETMRDDLISGVEMLTERKVLSFLSDHDAVNDRAVEVFILEP
jgi:uncharacterized protein YbcI